MLLYELIPLHTIDKSHIFNVRVCSGNQAIVLVRGCRMCCELLGLFVRRGGSVEAPIMTFSSFGVVRCRKILSHMVWGQGHLPFSSPLGKFSGAAILVVVRSRMTDSGLIIGRSTTMDALRRLSMLTVESDLAEKRRP